GGARGGGGGGGGGGGRGGRRARGRVPRAGPYAARRAPRRQGTGSRVEYSDHRHTVGGARPGALRTTGDAHEMAELGGERLHVGDLGNEDVEIGRASCRERGEIGGGA